MSSTSKGARTTTFERSAASMQSSSTAVCVRALFGERHLLEWFGAVAVRQGLEGRGSSPRARHRDRSRAWLRVCARRRPRDRRAPNVTGRTRRRGHRSRCRHVSGRRGRTDRWPLRLSRRVRSRGEAVRRTSGNGCRLLASACTATPNREPSPQSRDVRPMVSGPDGRQVVSKAPFGVEVAMGRWF